MTETRHLPGPATELWDWQLHAACRDHDNNLFFHPEHERGLAREHRAQQAKELCARCPVQRACLRHALAVDEPYGVWGGYTPNERRQLRTSLDEFAAL